MEKKYCDFPAGVLNCTIRFVEFVCLFVCFIGVFFVLVLGCLCFCFFSIKTDSVSFEHKNSKKWYKVGEGSCKSEMSFPPNFAA